MTTAAAVNSSSQTPRRPANASKVTSPSTASPRLARAHHRRDRNESIWHSQSLGAVIGDTTVAVPTESPGVGAITFMGELRRPVACRRDHAAVEATVTRLNDRNLLRPGTASPITVDHRGFSVITQNT